MFILKQNYMKKVLFLIFAIAVLLPGCSKTEKDPGINNGPGKLSVKITDDPFDISFVESATVTITKIEIRKTGDESGNPFIVLSENPVPVDLLDLRNGVKQELINLDIAAGSYDLVRLYVSEASLKIKDQPDAFRLKIPSGEQTGIKVFIAPALTVVGGLTSELILDFDLSKSFVMRGNMSHSAGVNGFIFKPCVRAINNSVAGTIEGFVSDNASEKIENAKVWVENMKDSIIGTAFTDQTGYYAFIIGEGTYKMFATKENYDTVSVNGVTVILANKTTQDFTIAKPFYYVSSVIENAAPDKLVITYSLALAATIPDASAFEVKVNDVVRSVSALSIDGTTVVLTLSGPVVKNDVVTVAYTKPATNLLESVGGYLADSFTAQDTTNNVGI
jgi:uncharacterized repeat protein (TIGR02059 family)